jgi:murein DD-endopeptidase MepM/ murein hydrolase activator NlpD
MSTYRIRSGDTLSELASRFGTTVAELARTNHIANPNLIITGHTLRVPDGFDTKPRTHAKPPPPAAPTPSAHQQHVQHVRHQQHAQQTGAAPVSSAAPKGVAAQYDHFKKLIEQHGGKFRSGPNQKNLLGFRTPTSTYANGGNGRYDDRLVMLWKDSRGQPHVKFYEYNTEPANNLRSYSSDVNGDGRADQGRVPTGYHEYALSSWKHGFCLRATHDFSVQRDMNHDGRFSENSRTGGGASMLFHQGGSYSTGSAGCQTFPPSDWARFMSDVRGASGVIGYTLVER